MKSQPSVAIVIPMYQSVIQKDEKKSLTAWKKYLSQYNTYIVCPDDVVSPIKQAKVVHFEKKYFASVQSYSELLLTSFFYEHFKKYDYILIYQLDAVVYSNDLLFWMKKKYDYIGAPWWSSFIGFLSSPLGKRKLVGNGGLSLRKVSSMIDVLNRVKKVARTSSLSRKDILIHFLFSVFIGKSRGKWLPTSAEQYPFNEDGFWSFEAQKYLKTFKVPSFSEAHLFAVETHPDLSMKYLQGKKPFGCHAWKKYHASF